MLNSINLFVNFVQIWQIVISLVTMATNVDSKLLTTVYLFLSGTDHSVKVSSNSESVRAGAPLEFFGGYRELMLRKNFRFVKTKQFGSLKILALDLILVSWNSIVLIC